MVRTYQRKRLLYDRQQLLAAIRAVKERKMKVAVAASKYNVPPTTLYDHVKSKPLQRIGAGAPTILTAREEKEIVVSLQVLQEIGFGLTRDLVGMVIRDYLNDQPFRPNPFRNGVPGKDWWKLFLRRNSQLSERKPQHLSTHRALSCTPEVMDEWFKKVEQLLEKAGMNALPTDELKHYMWNCDESGFCTAVASKKILAKRGEKDVHDTLGGSGRDFITVLGAGCADGTCLPPFVVYKGKNLWSRWMTGGPAGCLYTVSDSGWMESGNFLQWFEKMFLPAVKHLTVKFPVLLFFDGHHSHMSLSLIRLARENNVHLICFPPHCTHILQPLDVSVFGPLKATWRKVLKEHQLATCAATVTKEDFPKLLANLWEQSPMEKHLISGFHKCGLCPVSRDIISPHKLSKALPHTKLPSVPKAAKETSENKDVEIVVKMAGVCTINDADTPIRLHLRGYFSQLLQKNKQQKCGPTDKRKTKPRFYGEALTLDEVFERVEEEEKEKEKSKKKKPTTKQSRKGKSKGTKVAAKKLSKAISPKVRRTRAKSVSCTVPPSTPSPVPAEDSDSSSTDDGICEECGGCYCDDSKEQKACWMGCDTCERWYHYQCVGLSRIPEGFWSCHFC